MYVYICIRKLEGHTLNVNSSYLWVVGLWVIIFSFCFSVFSNFSTMNMYYLCNKNY